MRPHIRFSSWNVSFVRFTVRLRYIHTYIFYLAISAERLRAAPEVVVVERRTQDLPTWFLIFVCPTRVMFERGFVKRSGVTIVGWTVGFLVVNLMFLFALPWLHQHLRCRFILLLLWAIPSSRIVEIGYAFYNDAFDQLEGFQPRSGLKRSQRLKLLGCSYFEVAVCYASLYLALPDTAFHNHPARPFESLYFSWITITTTGFGDIFPYSTFARTLCMSELGVGLMLIVFAVGAYFSYKGNGPDAKD